MNNMSLLFQCKQRLQQRQQAALNFTHSTKRRTFIIGNYRRTSEARALDIFAFMEPLLCEYLLQQILHCFVAHPLSLLSRCLAQKLFQFRVALRPSIETLPYPRSVGPSQSQQGPSSGRCAGIGPFLLTLAQNLASWRSLGISFFL